MTGPPADADPSPETVAALARAVHLAYCVERRPMHSHGWHSADAILRHLLAAPGERLLRERALDLAARAARAVPERLPSGSPGYDKERAAFNEGRAAVLAALRELQREDEA